MAGMSPAALARCKKLKLSTIEEGRTLLEVTDPRAGEKVVDTYTARTDQDVMRIRRAFVKKHSIPAENVRDERTPEAQ